MTVSVTRQTYDVTEVAKILGIGRNQVYDAIKDGRIQSIRLSERRVVVPKAVVEKLLNPPA